MSQRAPIFQGDFSALRSFREVLVDVEYVEGGLSSAGGHPNASDSERARLTLTASSASTTSAVVRCSAMAGIAVSLGPTPENLWKVVSRRTLRRRLSATGLRPAQAGAVLRDAVGHPDPAAILRQAMRHHHRKADSWFPWDLVIQ